VGEGVLTKDTHGTVVRFAPPLVVTNDQLDVAVAALARVLGRLRPA
jgi:ornithine--oxo-acid transaminase